MLFLKITLLPLNKLSRFCDRIPFTSLEFPGEKSVFVKKELNIRQTCNFNEVASFGEVASCILEKNVNENFSAGQNRTRTKDEKVLEMLEKIIEMFFEKYSVFDF